MERQQPSTGVKDHHPLQGATVVPKRNFKLLVDPQLRKGQEKLVRFDGELYSCQVS